MISTGIDVSAKELSVVILNKNKASKTLSFTNDGKGHQSLLKMLKKKKVDRVCLEATGVYHLDVSVLLHDSQCFEFMVINPRAAKHYSEARMSRCKTDAVDAVLLAGFAQHMPFKQWQRPDDNLLNIRACSRRLASLTKHRAQAKNQLHAIQATVTTPDIIVADIKLTIQQVEQQISALRDHALQLISKDEKTSRILTLLLSVKGIAEASAIQLMGELLVLPNDMTARQWVAMAGLDPKLHQSGTSINKKARISKVGNRYLRGALYMPALSASRHDQFVHGYYIHLIEHRGLKKIQAVCAVMRKLLHAIHGMLRTNSTFDSTRFYRASEQVS